MYDKGITEEEVTDCLKTIYDPEIPVNIFDLGLIYGVDIQPGNRVHIVMTLTTATCPAAAFMPEEVRREVANIPGVEEVKVEVVFDPPWMPGMMSSQAREILGI